MFVEKKLKYSKEWTNDSRSYIFFSSHVSWWEISSKLYSCKFCTSLSLAHECSRETLRWKLESVGNAFLAGHIVIWMIDDAFWKIKLFTNFSRIRFQLTMVVFLVRFFPLPKKRILWFFLAFSISVALEVKESKVITERASCWKHQLLLNNLNSKSCVDKMFPTSITDVPRFKISSNNHLLKNSDQELNHFPFLTLPCLLLKWLLKRMKQMMKRLFNFHLPTKILPYRPTPLLALQRSTAPLPDSPFAMKFQPTSFLCCLYTYTSFFLCVFLYKRFSRDNWTPVSLQHEICSVCIALCHVFRTWIDEPGDNFQEKVNWYIFTCQSKKSDVWKWTEEAKILPTSF